MTRILKKLHTKIITHTKIHANDIYYHIHSARIRQVRNIWEIDVCEYNISKIINVCKWSISRLFEIFFTYLNLPFYVQSNSVIEYVNKLSKWNVSLISLILNPLFIHSILDLLVSVIFMILFQYMLLYVVKFEYGKRSIWNISCQVSKFLSIE